MKKLLSYFIILTCIMGAMPVTGSDDTVIPAGSTALCGNFDLASGIAAVSGLVKSESPLGAQLRSQGAGARTETAVAASNLFRAYGCFGALKVLADDVMAAAVLFPALFIRPSLFLLSRGSPGGTNILMLSFLVYLIILARKNLPGETIIAIIANKETRSDVKRPGFSFGSLP